MPNSTSIRAVRSSFTRRKLRFEHLEARQMLTTFTVLNLNDAVVTAAGNAPGTLRQAIFDANASPNPDVVEFAAGLSGSVNLFVMGDIDPTAGASDLLITSPITIRGNANGITIQCDATATDRRLFRLTSSGDLTLESIMLAGGTSRGANGGAGQDGGTAFGGAIYNQGTLHVVSSTLFGNHAVGGNTTGGGTVGAGIGGAIYNDGGTVSISNSTLSGNSVQSGTGGASSSSFGGAVYSKNGTLQIYNSTITLNNATSGREVYVIGVGAGQTANLAIYSSIVAQADIAHFLDLNAVSDQGGSIIVSGANNLIRSQNDYPSVTVSNDPPLLGDLANNGGPTLTHALLSGSPAIDQGSNPQSLANDQRGSSFGRTIGSGTDIGAFEVQTLAGPALPGDYNVNVVVDAADYVLWRKTLGASVTQFSGADGNGSGTVDAGDYDVWRGHFGTAPGAGETMPTGSPTMKISEVRTNSSSVEAGQLLVGSTLSAALPHNKDQFDLAGHSPTLPASSEPSRDLALLSLTNPDPTARLLSRSSDWTDIAGNTGKIAIASESDDLLGVALNRALLQMPTLFSASTCKA